MPALIVIAGPTASGKTSLAIQLAQHFSTEILSADSRQFYKGLDIGTAKPSDTQLAAVRHHFINSHEVMKAYNIADYEKDAIELLHRIFQSKSTAILAGGSGLYIRAVCHGLDEVPERNDEVRAQIQSLLEQEGISALQTKLKKLDEEYFNSVDISNPHRLIRALEVCILTGQKFSDLRKNKSVQREFDTMKIGLLVERDELYARIDKRVDEMMEAGLLNEVKSMIPFRSMNSLNTVGYKELFEYLDGKISLDEAIRLIKQNTRNYAKRQMTWFRKEANIKWFEPEHVPDIINYLEDQISPK